MASSAVAVERMFRKYYFYCDSLTNAPLYSYMKAESSQAKLLLGYKVISYHGLDSLINSGKYASVKLYLTDNSFFESSKYRVDSSSVVFDDLNRHAFKDIHHLYLNRKKKWGRYIGYPILGFIGGALQPLIYESIRYSVYKEFKTGPSLFFGCLGAAVGTIAIWTPERERVNFYYPTEGALR